MAKTNNLRVKMRGMPLKKGIDVLADAVKVTLGPKGHCVAPRQEMGSPLGH